MALLANIQTNKQTNKQTQTKQQHEVIACSNCFLSKENQQYTDQPVADLEIQKGAGVQPLVHKAQPKILGCHAHFWSRKCIHDTRNYCRS